MPRLRSEGRIAPVALPRLRSESRKAPVALPRLRSESGKAPVALPRLEVKVGRLLSRCRVLVSLLIFRLICALVALPRCTGSRCVSPVLLSSTESVALFHSTQVYSGS